MEEDIRTIAANYISHGISVIPTFGKCSGPWKIYQKSFIDPKLFKQGHNIAMICGEISGNLECLDIDLKNFDEEITLGGFVSLIPKTILHKMVIEETVSGGYHFVYRLPEKTARNIILARTKEKAVTLEVRGEGGYFVCAPSFGYELKRGNFNNIHIISMKEREELFSIARRFNKYVNPLFVYNKKKYVKPKGEVSPIDDFKNKTSMVKLMEDFGFKILNEKNGIVSFLRQGSKKKKTGDIFLDSNLMYMFSSSTPFDPFKTYGVLDVWMVFNNINNLSDAAKKLREKGYGS